MKHRRCLPVGKAAHETQTLVRFRNHIRSPGPPAQMRKNQTRGKKSDRAADVNLIFEMYGKAVQMLPRSEKLDHD